MHIIQHWHFMTSTFHSSLQILLASKAFKTSSFGFFRRSKPCTSAPSGSMATMRMPCFPKSSTFKSDKAKTGGRPGACAMAKKTSTKWLRSFIYSFSLHSDLHMVFWLEARHKLDEHFCWTCVKHVSDKRERTIHPYLPAVFATEPGLGKWAWQWNEPVGFFHPANPLLNSGFLARRHATRGARNLWTLRESIAGQDTTSLFCSLDCNSQDLLATSCSKHLEKMSIFKIHLLYINLYISNVWYYT